MRSNRRRSSTRKSRPFGPTLQCRRSRRLTRMRRRRRKAARVFDTRPDSLRCRRCQAVYEGTFSTLKTAAGVREIPLSDATVQGLGVALGIVAAGAVVILLAVNSPTGKIGKTPPQAFYGFAIVAATGAA